MLKHIVTRKARLKEAHNAPFTGVRTALLEVMPKDGIVAEVGVLWGDHAYKMLKETQPKKLYLIDCWQTQHGVYVNDPCNDTYFLEAYNKVKSRFAKFSNVDVVRMYSVHAARKFENEYFDWVYIDANHHFRGIWTDLKAWWPKIKQGGYMAGHDYGTRKWVKVQTAVDLFATKRGLIVQTADANDFTGMPEWYLQKS